MIFFHVNFSFTPRSERARTLGNTFPCTRALHVRSHAISCDPVLEKPAPSHTASARADPNLSIASSRPSSTTESNSGIP